ncbi:MAG: hypothetical protein OEX81_04985 [Candidatus Pacebacteria bacterium]|nr:hypothetical protein [Candidatus Paceibacterota bacterium]
MNEQSFEQPPQPSFNPDTQRDPSTQIKDSDIQTESGLYIPGGTNAARQVEAERNDQDKIAVDDPVAVESQDESRSEQILKPEDGELDEKENPHANETLEERAQNSVEASEALEDSNHPTMTATTEEEFISAHTNEYKTAKIKEVLDAAREKAIAEAKAKGTEDEDELKKIGDEAALAAREDAEAQGAQAAADAEKGAKTLLDRAAEIAGISFGEFQKAHEGSDMKTFIDLFLVFNVEGKYGSGLSSMNETEATPGDKILRAKLDGKPVDFVEAMSMSVYNHMKNEGGSLPPEFKDFIGLNKEDAAKDPQMIYKAVKYFNHLARTDKGWGHLQTGLAEFCGSPEYQFGLETKKLFTSLESISAIKQFLNIDSSNDSSESNATGKSD